MDLKNLRWAVFEEAIRSHTGQRGYHCLEVDEACEAACLYVWVEGPGTPFSEDHAVVYDGEDPITVALMRAVSDTSAMRSWRLYD